MNAEELLKEVDKRYGVSSQEVLTISPKISQSDPDEIKYIMEKIKDLTAADIFSTLIHIKNPKRSDKLVNEPYLKTVHDNDGNIKSEPEDWIEFGGKWYDKRELVKK